MAEKHDSFQLQYDGVFTASHPVSRSITSLLTDRSPAQVQQN